MNSIEIIDPIKVLLIKGPKYYSKEFVTFRSNHLFIIQD